ncbi:dolichyl-phosphate beta-glucosyltransferase [Sphaeroforma arctica JP610]|uniref:dolichyl-phosphate beta-glucosyltransferase n=1 Tax=Sphaeroforma arctica JP610 TaxID=667725 RepID=A0A0L0FH80_9EUKA|nr:dolichyl-phosphate beta-glucosyltransferase [Sphaeroforma arctica JP610]KNC75836.1 dolichyl-phosphate beta-glucosyltransferase [Sphaeroforma arctica JP610]|eukprot:XP_014149738.1 dolichyl-phosphate beta-glucosyltransferase [Sphaeroforma arctica JP610]
MLAATTKQEEEEGSVYLTLVVPAYNEEDRMPAMLKETIEYLSKRQKKYKSFTYEFVIVDDGSKDKTYEIAMNESEKYGDDVVRVLKFEKNRGKGGAVRLGMEVARGKYILMVDADAATDINDLDRVEDKLKEIERDGYGIVVGSRAHMAEDESPAAQRSAFRRFLQKGFHFLVQFLGGVKGIHDTQCGFKLFTRKSAADVTRVLHLERWCFDVEALYIGQCLNMPLAEVAVNWQEIDGSKLDPTQAMIEMFKDLVTIKTYYTLGIWSIPKETLAHKRKVE